VDGRAAGPPRIGFAGVVSRGRVAAQLARAEPGDTQLARAEPGDAQLARAERTDRSPAVV